MSTDHVSPIEPGEAEELKDGIALCLSGGGYRAMLFHVGALWRLNQLGYLRRLDRVSSVSGGSITAGCLGMNWDRLRFGDGGVAEGFDEQVVKPIRRLAGKTIDVGSVLGGILMPRKTVAEQVAAAYRKHLFGEAKLKDLPDDPPRFVINATNLQTGSLWRFSKPYMADYRVGVVRDPDVDLATAVGASAAFPPVLSPVRLSVPGGAFAADRRGRLDRAPFTTDVVLSDGGVYDNLGLQTAWESYRTVLVSDGGGQLAPEEKVSSDWVQHSIRVASVVDNQVRSLRKRATIDGFLKKERSGAYWSIRSEVEKYGPPEGSLDCPPARVAALAAEKTRLKALDDALQERLINWGYAMCDIAMRAYVETEAPAPSGFPYPRGI
jgi:NTE family protein